CSPKRKVRMAEVTDGTSNTLAIGERASLFTQAPWVGAVNFGTTRVTPGALTKNLSAIEDAPTQVLAHVDIDTINDPNADPEDFFTPHIGVCNRLFVDGSVRPVRTQIALSVLQALATSNGGEVINSSAY